MAKNKQRVESKHGKKSQSGTKPVVSKETEKERSDSLDLTTGFTTFDESNSTKVQAMWFTDRQLPLIDRRAMVARIVERQGNHQLQHILTQIQRNESFIHQEQMESTGSFSFAKGPNIHPPINPSAATLIQREEVSVASQYHQLSQDSIYETLAHEVVYGDSRSPKKMQRLIERLNRLGFTPLPLRHGAYSFEMQGFKDNGAGKNRFPLLAFRGTQELLDWLIDLDPEGVGHPQFVRNFNLIAGEIDRMGGRVDVTGHSLGGALAQITAVVFPSKVRQVITFQSPGLPAGVIDRLVNYNRHVPVEDRVRSRHYRAEGDVVDNAGYGFTPGTVYELSTDLVTLASVIGRMIGGILGGLAGRAVSSHTTYLLYEINRLRRVDPERFRQLTIEVHSTRTGQDARGFRPAEMLRRGVPVVTGIPSTRRNSVLDSFINDLESDDLVRDRVFNEPGYLTGRSFEEKVEMIRILVRDNDSDEDIAAVIRIINTMSRSEKERIRTQMWDELFSSCRMQSRHRIGYACNH